VQKCRESGDSKMLYDLRAMSPREVPEIPYNSLLREEEGNLHEISRRKSAIPEGGNGRINASAVLQENEEKWREKVSWRNPARKKYIKYSLCLRREIENLSVISFSYQSLWEGEAERESLLLWASTFLSGLSCLREWLRCNRDSEEREKSLA